MYPSLFIMGQCVLSSVPLWKQMFDIVWILSIILSVFTYHFFWEGKNSQVSAMQVANP